MKVMDQKTLVKRRSSYKVRLTVYILTPSEFCQTLVHKSLIREALPDTLSLSLTGIRHGPKQARRVNDSTDSLSPAERWTITETRRSSNSVLTYSLLTDVILTVCFVVKPVMERKLLMVSRIFSLQPLYALNGLSVVFLLKKEALIK